MVHANILMRLLVVILAFTNTQSASAITSVVPNAAWFPAGLDVIRDPLSGRLAVPEYFGAAIVSGSANSPVIWQDPITKDALLYVGASNGGVYLRRYSYSNHRWSDRWSWVSRPDSGYAGSQSIAVLSISPDGHYLAVGQGNPSNYKTLGVNGNGVQIGAIEIDGSIRWLANSKEANETISGVPIRSLHWRAANLIATAFANGEGGLLTLTQSDSGGIGEAKIIPSGNFNYMSSSLTISDQSYLLLTGHNTTSASGFYNNRVGFYVDVSGTPTISYLQGNLYSVYLRELEAKNLRIGRVSIYPHLINGGLIAFIGSWVNGLKSPIGQIDRLVINPITGELLEYQSAEVVNKIGTDQAMNNDFYGNFSLSADPIDPEGRRVFAGGNTYGGINAYTYAGGLAAVGFETDPPSIDYLYGPHGDLANVGDEAPGAPHADSRQIIYYETPEGLALIQSDDGGIWQLPLQTQGIRWWSSLSAPGLNTLENTIVDWNGASNSLLAAYQDNACSIGQFGSAYPYMNNISSGDGSLAFFDDAKPSDLEHFTSGYFSSQNYLERGKIQRVAVDQYGFLKSYDNIEIFVNIKGDLSPLTEKGLLALQELSTPFNAPVSATPSAYRTGDIVLAGQFNVYETIAVDDASLPDSLIFNTLFDWNEDPLTSPKQLNTYWVNSIDNQGSKQYKNQAFDSLYIGLQIAGPGGKDLIFSGIYGRQAGTSQKIGPIYSLDAKSGAIVAITHRPNQGQRDTLYWLQGGMPIGNQNRSNQVSIESPQLLGIHLPGGQNILMNPEDLGVQFNAKNLNIKAQSLVYIPATKTHREYLVLASQEGAWMASLSASGLPESFTRMKWMDFPDATSPGSFNLGLKYDPQDDLLVSTMLGQGVWLYSFSGQLEQAKISNQNIILSDTVLRLQSAPDPDKRGNQSNTSIFVQLNDKKMDPSKAYDVDLVFHNFSQWQNNLELLSPMAETVVKAPAAYNLLGASGQARFNATLKNGKLTLPIHFEPGVSKMAVTVNAKEFPEFAPTFSLNFSASLRGEKVQSKGHLVFDSGSPSYSVYIPGGRNILDPFSLVFNPQDTSLSRFRFSNEKWVAGPIKHIQDQNYSDDDIVYVGTQGNKIMTGKGADLLYVDGHTRGVNQLFGGPGKDQFRLVSTSGHLPHNAQWIMDFKPGEDSIGLAGATYKDLSFRNSPEGAVLYLYKEKVGVFKNIDSATLKRKSNFIFYY